MFLAEGDVCCEGVMFDRWVHTYMQVDEEK